MYLSFNEYISMGGLLDQAAYTRLEFKARQLIDTRTFGRVKGLSPTPEAVKRLVFELIGLADQEDKGGAVTSMSNDGYSESYAVVNNEEKSISLIVAYLSRETTSDGVPLLYRGC